MSRKKREEHLAAHKRCDSLCTSDRSVYLGAVVNDQSSHLVTGSLRSFRLDSWSSTGLSGNDIDQRIRDRVVFNLSLIFLMGNVQDHFGAPLRQVIHSMWGFFW